MDLPIKNNLAQQLALWTAGTKESVGGSRAAVPRASRGCGGGGVGRSSRQLAARDSRALRGRAADGSAGASATGRARSRSPSCSWSRAWRR